MATSLRLDYEAASAQAKIVEQDAAEIETILNNLVEDMNANLNNSQVWQGAAATKFKSTWDKCSDTFGEFVNHIRTIQSKIDVTAQETRTFDQQ